MVVNENAGSLIPLGALRFIASRLAPTGECVGISGWPVRVSKGTADPVHRSGGPDQIIRPGGSQASGA